jgi:hypothetical protein
MPEPPASSLFIRWFLENPWPLGGLALLAAAVLVWMGLREGLKRHLQVGGGFGVLGIAVFVIAALVTTAGEHAKAVTAKLVAAAEKADLVAARGLFADDASLSFGSPENPGLDFSELSRRLDMLGGRYRIEENDVLSLKGYTVSGDTGVAHLSCLTQVESGYGPTPSAWVLRVRRDETGEWRISRLTLVSVAGQTGTDVFR